MSAPDDELVEAVAEVLWEGHSKPFIRWADLSEPLREMQYEQARAVLSVPALAEVIARDAKVRGIVTEFFAPEPHRSAGKPMRANNAFHDIAALYPEAGK